MIKICPRCRRTFSGGTTCLSCAEEVALLDVADPSVRRAHLKSDGELRVTIRTYYGARSAMLLLFQAILFGLALAVVLLRKASSVEGLGRAVLWALALVSALGLPAFTAWAGARLVHRFSRSCRHRPIKPRELRVIRRGQNLA